MHRRQDRRRRSRSPSRHARPQDSRSRSRRRSPRQGRRPPSTSRFPTNQTQFEDIRKIPSHWKPTSDMLDYNTVYGMPLPRRVVSTSASRTLGIDNIPVHEIRLIQVLQDSSYDWCLRQIGSREELLLGDVPITPRSFFQHGITSTFTGFKDRLQSSPSSCGSIQQHAMRFDSLGEQENGQCKTYPGCGRLHDLYGGLQRDRTSHRTPSSPGDRERPTSSQPGQPIPTRRNRLPARRGHQHRSTNTR